MGESSAARTQRLIDELIDQAHREWPAVTYVLRLPSGEALLVPRHLNGSADCTADHRGYYANSVRPHCRVDPVPGHRGLCRASPIAGATQEVPTYVVDLRSGVLTRVRPTDVPAD